VALSGRAVYSEGMTGPAATTDADRRIAALAALAPLRVWSAIITIFGDSVRVRGGTVAATTLAAIAERLDIRPEALRVALHRLVRDGWVTRTRQGRHAFYSLSAEGVAKFEPATRRIYAAGPAETGPWRLAVLPADAARESAEAAARGAGFHPVAPGVLLGPAGAGAAPDGAFVVEGAPGRPLPGWLTAGFGPPDLARDYARLAAELDALRDWLAGGATPAPLDAVALRTLVIHQWRRLLLRHPDLPAEFFPEGWPGERCRARVLELHAALSPAADDWLDAAFAG
jgi:phenylacetic acid degradation operon negative regulatory protein